MNPESDPLGSGYHIIQSTIAVGSGGIIYSSTNGTAWTSRTSGVATNLNGVCWADTLARVLIAPAELPVGVITAFCGAPFFVYLLRRGREREVGLA